MICHIFCSVRLLKVLSGYDLFLVLWYTSSSSSIAPQHLFSLSVCVNLPAFSLSLPFMSLLIHYLTHKSGVKRYSQSQSVCLLWRGNGEGCVADLGGAEGWHHSSITRSAADWAAPFPTAFIPHAYSPKWTCHQESLFLPEIQHCLPGRFDFWNLSSLFQTQASCSRTRPDRLWRRSYSLISMCWGFSSSASLWAMPSTSSYSSSCKLH